MRALYNKSIRSKLMVLITAAATLTVLTACTVLWIYQLIDYRSTLRTEESAMAQLVAESSAPALLFNDGPAANENLALLRADPRIEAACLYNKTGKVIAQFSSGVELGTCPANERAQMRFAHRHLLIFRPIVSQGEPVGSLYLNVSLAEMYRLLVRFAETMVYLLILSSLFAFGLSSFLQGIISEPIIALTRVATQVSDQGNYLLRAKRFSDDEAGVLIDQFNAMMDRIQQREADLQQAHASLEDKVKARTLDLRSEIAERKLIERDLGKAKLAAEESNRAKSAFLATMSHELRTPLNAIIGYSEMLHEDAQAAGSESMTGDLDKVLFSARHLLALISDILDLSRIEAGEMTVFPELVSASSLLSEVLPTAEILAKRNDNILETGEEMWDGKLLVDPTRFRQCLLNLVSNSCKFTEHGRITIDVREEDKKGEPWVLWSIRDTGPGISAEGLKRLFQTFSQVDSSSTRKHGGSGLGLAISQQLCHAMGGYISVESEPGKGSTFTIHIPAANESMDDAELAVPDVHQQAGASRQ
jgi:signal transduction histidine kinase